MAKRMKAFIFNEETLHELAEAWLVYDPEGSGLMDAAQYIDFMMNLKQPIAMSTQDLKKKLTTLALDLRAIFINTQASNNVESLDSSMRVDGMDMGTFITRQIYKENRDKTIRLTVDQFFVFCRLYNVPVYVVHSKK